MSDADPKHPPYLRRVTFIDTTPDEPGQLPVSVPNRLLLDGVDHSEVLAGGTPEWEITGIPEVLVSFVAVAEHVELQTYPSRSDADETHLSGSHIAGIPVLTPTSHEWEVLSLDAAGEPLLVRVWFFARQIEVLAENRAVPAPGDSHAAAAS